VGIIHNKTIFFAITQKSKNRSFSLGMTSFSWNNKNHVFQPGKAVFSYKTELAILPSNNSLKDFQKTCVLEYMGVIPTETGNVSNL
jgi:hypothetical protein